MHMNIPGAVALEHLHGSVLFAAVARTHPNQQAATIQLRLQCAVMAAVDLPCESVRWLESPFPFRAWHRWSLCRVFSLCGVVVVHAACAAGALNEKKFIGVPIA